MVLLPSYFFILDLDQKYHIKVDGQLQILNFDPNSDSAVYECHYKVKTATLGVSSYKLAQSSNQGPLVTGKKYHLVNEKHENYEKSSILNARSIVCTGFVLLFLNYTYYDFITLLDRMLPFMPEFAVKVTWL